MSGYQTTASARLRAALSCLGLSLGFVLPWPAAAAGQSQPPDAPAAGWQLASAAGQSAPVPVAEASAARPEQHPGIYIRPVVEAGYELGGEKLVEVQCQNTTDNSVSTPGLRAGNGLIAGLGGHLRPYRQSPFDLRLTFDYKYQSACSSVNLQRFRFTLLPNYRFGPRQRWWAGAGLIYETGIRFDGKNLPVANAPGETLGTFDFNDALGGTVQVGWWFVALDYNILKYSKDGTHFNANSVGLLFTYGFDFF